MSETPPTERTYAYDFRHAASRAFASLVLWLVVFGVAGGAAHYKFADSIPNPLVLVPVCAAALACVVSLIHARRFWPRLVRRGVQLELRATGVRAAQLGGEEVLWTAVSAIRGSEAEGTREYAFLTLVLHDEREVELDVYGFTAPLEEIVREATRIWVAGLKKR
jgi:fumarate reductase subunit C